MDAISVKCPTCARPKGTACIALVKDPAGQVRWATAGDPHPARRPHA